jgi:hypothetical protein
MSSCCLHINKLPVSLTMPLELVKFCNVKTKYYVNEDILLEYELNAEVGYMSRVTILSTFR